jgi:enamine deaminase RidA (YjgF/YER057c/UK114 family)
VSASERLAEMNLVLPQTAAPVGAYVPAVRHGDLIYTSGQLPFTDGRLPATGRVGAEIEPVEATALARTCALNAIAAAAAVAGTVDALGGVVKVTGFVASAAGFHGQPGVVDGASTLFFEVFGDAGRHARSAVGVAELPLGSPVEVEAVFALIRPAG